MFTSGKPKRHDCGSHDPPGWTRAARRHLTRGAVLGALTAGATAGGCQPAGLTQEYFSVTPDLRRCISPLCGGVFVRAVNLPLTQCVDGSLEESCYLAEVDSSAVGGDPGLPLSTPTVVRGRMTPREFDGFGNLGALVVREAWSSATDAAANGTFYRVEDNGIRCVTTPCFSTDATALNRERATTALSDLDLSSAGASDSQLGEAALAIASGDLIVAGALRQANESGTVSVSLTASQFFLPSCGGDACLAGCSVDADCDATQWCRPSEAGGRSCVPFAGEGDSCGGFTLPSAQERCLPELTCDLPEFVADVPGRCRSRCDSNDDCARDAYCATDSLCHADGSCDYPIDCTLEGNVFLSIACAGVMTCNPPFGGNGQCGVQCGLPPACMDRVAQDFGACEAILGAGVLRGSCQQISGCSADVPLFSSVAECERSCGGDELGGPLP